MSGDDKFVGLNNFEPGHEPPGLRVVRWWRRPRLSSYVPMIRPVVFAFSLGFGALFFFRSPIPSWTYTLVAYVWLGGFFLIRYRLTRIGLYQAEGVLIARSFWHELSIPEASVVQMRQRVPTRFQRIFGPWVATEIEYLNAGKRKVFVVIFDAS